MARGIRITITRIVDQLREPGRDYPGTHRIWNGTRWVSLSSNVVKPSFAAMAGITPKAHSTVLEFLPPGTVTLDALRYRAGLMKQMERAGVLR